jgi:biopolymer transport protein ExbB/TolQ
MNAETQIPTLGSWPSRIGAGLAIAGAILQLSPLLGVAGTIASMMKAFRALGDAGVADPAQLSVSIGQVLVSTATGIALGLGGMACLAAGVLLFNYRQRWARIMLIILGVLWGLGLVVGGVLYTAARPGEPIESPAS